MLASERSPTRLGVGIYACLILCALIFAACASHGDLDPDDHVVAAPISARANTVLNNLVTECDVVGGRWEHDMGPGCSAIWATAFGYQAGVRRNRKDLIRLGEITAVGEAAALRKVIWSALSGDLDKRSALGIIENS